MKAEKWSLKKIKKQELVEGDRLTFYINGFVYIREFYKGEEANLLFQTLLHNIDWKEGQTLTIDGNKTPRLEAWYGDDGIDSYTYRGMLRSSSPWSPVLVKIKQLIEQKEGLSFNSAGLRLFRNGKDNVRFHIDNDKSLGTHPLTASVYFGGPREIRLEGIAKIELQSGSLIIMKSQMTREIAVTTKQPEPLPFIELTFRQICYFPKHDINKILNPERYNKRIPR